MASLRLKIERDLEWLFREQVEDYGLDAMIEVVEDRKPTGRIIAAQIKSGDSFFEERTEKGVIFRGGEEHLEYWLQHKLPVIVVLHHPETDHAIWQSVTEENIERTGKGWKMVIPLRQLVDTGHAEALKQVSSGTPYFQRLAELQLALPWMDLLETGDRLFVVTDVWVNKSSGRCSISLVREDDAEDVVLQEWEYGIYYPGGGIHFGLQKDFPWADFVFIESDDSSGEIESTRFEVVLNDLGKAFLLAQGHLSAPKERSIEEAFEFPRPPRDGDDYGPDD